MLPQVEEAVEEYLMLQDLLCQGEKLQTKLQEEMAFLEGAESHPDHLILTLEQRSESTKPLTVISSVWYILLSHLKTCTLFWIWLVLV